LPWLPDSALFRFSATLRLATISKCRISEGAVGALRFPQLRELALESVRISEESLQSMIAGSPVLECLLLSRSVGFSRVRINSRSLVSIGVRDFSGELIIGNAPSLERLLQLELFRDLRVSIVSALKLETLCWISDRDHYFKLAFGTAAVQVLGVLLLPSQGFSSNLRVHRKFHIIYICGDRLMQCTFCVC